MQFKSGAEQLWSHVEQYPYVLKELFVFVPEQKMSFQQIRQMYDIEWSVHGSSRKTLEEMTIYSFEFTLQMLEG
jgi:hypothetical protein